MTCMRGTVDTLYKVYEIRYLPRSVTTVPEKKHFDDFMRGIVVPCGHIERSPPTVSSHSILASCDPTPCLRHGSIYNSNISRRSLNHHRSWIISTLAVLSLLFFFFFLKKMEGKKVRPTKGQKKPLWRGIEPRSPAVGQQW